MDVHGSRDPERSDSGAAAVLPPQAPDHCEVRPSDIQRHKGAGHPSELPDFDPAPAYEKDIHDGRLRDLHPSVHPSRSKAPRQAETDYRAKDHLLVERLAKNNFAGPEYDLMVERLVTVGYRYCLSWLRSGKMHAKCMEKGRPVGAFPEGVPLEELRDLAVDTAVEGAVLFRRVALVGRRWQPYGGASLVTYYVGACIQVYPTIYRRWLRARNQYLFTDPHEAVPDSSPPMVNEDYLVLTLLLQKELDEPTWVALKMKAEGATHAEIGQVLGRTGKAVEGLLHRGRARASVIVKRDGEHHV